MIFVALSSINEMPEQQMLRRSKLTRHSQIRKEKDLLQSIEQAP